MRIKNLSVFFPLFNEEGNVEEDVKRARNVLEKLKINYEILLINDGSKDKTGQIADKIARDDKRVRVIHHHTNLGYGEALKSGFYNAKYDVIVYTDGDGQFDFAEVTKFLEKIENFDLLIGYRIKRQDPFFRIFFKKGWGLSLWTMYGLTLKDVDCGFKMVKREVLQKIPHLESTRGAMINAELAIKAKKYGFKVGQIGVNHFPRLSGKPTGASLKVIFKSFVDLFKLWWKLHESKKLFFVFLAIVILAAFLRLYKIDQYMIFLGDEGRDALVVKRMVEEKHFPAIGPPTSVGNIYLGPLYYYMMFFPMVFFGLNPVAASVMVAVIGVLTVILIYLLGKTWFGREVGLMASFLYAISPVNINYSNFSWNPNPAPFFALAVLASFYKLNKRGNFLWLILTGVFLGAALQMHYLAIILIPLCFILWVHEVWLRFYKKLPINNLFWGTILGIVSFLIIMSPLFFFDIRHNFLNYRSVVELFSSSGSVKIDFLGNFSKIPQVFNKNLIGRYLAGENLLVASLISLTLITLGFYWFINRIKKHKLDWPRMALLLWIIVGLIGVSFYQGEIFDHYLGFVNPAPFLLFSSILGIKVRVLNNKWIKMSLILVIVLVLTLVNLQQNPFKNPPNNQLKRTQDIAKFIIAQASGRDFNFALLSKNNYDSAYIFYLEQYGHKPKNVPFEKTMQLFVVCEDPCDPIYSPKFEIAAFGWTLVERVWDIKGLKIYKLIHNPEEQKI